MMQDGKALQAGTSHYLGTNFAQASGIKYQNREGGESLAHTTSWGVSTRMVGGVIMTHGDDDGLRLPPKIAPQQVVILPMLRDKPEDEALIDYCEALRATLASQTVLGEPLRVLLDTRPGKAAQKRWDYVRKGAPVIVEVGGRDMDNGVVSILRRDRLWDAETGKPAFQNPTREVAGQTIPDFLADMQNALLTQAAERRGRQHHARRHRLRGCREAFRRLALSGLGRGPVVETYGRALEDGRAAEGAQAHHPQRADGCGAGGWSVHLHRQAASGTDPAGEGLLVSRDMGTARPHMAGMTKQNKFRKPQELRQPFRTPNSSRPPIPRRQAQIARLKGQEKIALKKRLKDIEEGLIDGKRTAYHRMGGVLVTVLKIVAIEDGEAIAEPETTPDSRKSRRGWW